MKRSIIDVKDRSEALQKVNKKMDSLSHGFYALAQDYGFHVEGISGSGRHKIFELRDNTIYRLFSAVFHFQLLLEQHYVIEHRFLEIFKHEPDKILGEVFPKHPLFENAEKETSSLLDSIVYHLSSVYDYLSILINFICVKDRDKTPQWNNLKKTAINNPTEINSKEVAELISRLSNEFVNKLYDHRSELIHRKGDLNEHMTILKIDHNNPQNAEFTVNFVCSGRLRKHFKEFGEKSLDYGIAYFSSWLIDRAMDTIAEVLVSLRRAMESNTNFPKFMFTNKASDQLFLGYADPQTNTLQSPSIVFWKMFEQDFHVK